jgi:hypothetical protein
MLSESTADKNAVVLSILDSEEFYLQLHEKPISKRDRLAIARFVSKSMEKSEWDRFEEHCLQNDLDPYHEFREAAVSSYARMMILNEKLKQYTMA